MRRFWDKVVEGPNDCWNWIGTKDKDGYGVFKLNGKNVKAHRLVLSFVGVIIPANMQVLHRCDNSSCVYPQHLFLGNQQLNMLDMMVKGRGRGQKGAAHAKAKIDEEKAIRILKSCREKLYLHTQIAEMEKVPYNIVAKIALRKTWKHLP